MNSISLLAVAYLGVGEYVAGAAVLLAIVLMRFLLWKCWGLLCEARAKGKWESFLAFVLVVLILLGSWVAGWAGYSYAKPQLQTLFGAINSAIASAISPADSAGK